MDFMRNFEDDAFCADGPGFWLPMDMPLGDKQVNMLREELKENLKPDLYYSLEGIGHDHYGSFMIFTKPETDRTDDLKEAVWEAAENLIINFHHIEQFNEFVAECVMNPEDDTDVAGGIDYYCELHRECGYKIPSNKKLIKELVEHGIPEEEVKEALPFMILQEVA